ncbi:MAG: uroporphyrinogen decarboxylase family protein [Oscillospiraceae bacterium]
MFLKVWQPKRIFRFTPEAGEQGASAVPAAPVSSGAPLTAMAVIKAWSPFIILTAMVTVWSIKPFKALFDHVREKGAFSSFFVCGDATRNIEVMCQTGPDSISVDENVNLLQAKSITDRYNVTIGGNIPLTTVMLHGTQQDNMKFVVELMDALPDKHNMIVAPGCDMPYDVPVENGIGVAQAVLHTDEVREMVKNYVAAEDNTAVELPDYAALKKPLMEVFTLDSATCAACTYMLGAASAAKAEYGEKLDMVEYKFTEKENIARCKKMGVTNLPAIYLNGQLKFQSIIPSSEELRAAVEESLAALQ